MAVGGYGNYTDDFIPVLSDVEVLDPTKEDSSCTAPPNYPQAASHMTSQAICGTLVCGGDSGLYLNNCYEYANKRWIERPPLLHPRKFSSSVVINTSSMWISGGSAWRGESAETTSEIISIDQGIPILGVDLPEKMSKHCSASINTTHVFLAGNYYNTKMAYIVDTSTSPFKFIKLPPLLGNREAAGCGVSVSETKDTQLIVAGGYDWSGAMLMTSELYSIKQKQWVDGPALPRGFEHGASVSNKEHPLMLIGGQDENGNVRGDIMDYDAKTNSFQILPGQLKTPRKVFSVVGLKTEDIC